MSFWVRTCAVFYHLNLCNIFMYDAMTSVGCSMKRQTKGFGVTYAIRNADTKRDVDIESPFTDKVLVDWSAAAVSLCTGKRWMSGWCVYYGIMCDVMCGEILIEMLLVIWPWTHTHRFRMAIFLGNIWHYKYIWNVDGFLTACSNRLWFFYVFPRFLVFCLRFVCLFSTVVLPSFIDVRKRSCNKGNNTARGCCQSVPYKVL